MKIAFLGCGATGSVFASYLRRGGADDLWLIDLYKAHMDKIRDEGLLFREPGGETLLTGFNTAYSPEGVGLCDVLIVLVKATGTESAMQGASCCIGPDTVVISLQNGLGNDLALQKFVPADRIVYGCGRIGTELPEPGVCVSKPNAGISNMFFGPVQKSARTDEVCQYLVDTFNAGGLLPEYHDDIRPYVWKKAASNSGFNTVCATLALKMKEVAADENGMALVDQILREASEVAKALGISENLYESLIKDVPNTVKNLGNYYPSMAQDLIIHKRQTEVDALSGAISMYGKSCGVPTPTCDVLSQVIKAIQANYEVRYKF